MAAALILPACMGDAEAATGDLYECVPIEGGLQRFDSMAFAFGCGFDLDVDLPAATAWCCVERESGTECYERPTFWKDGFIGATCDEGGALALLLH